MNRDYKKVNRRAWQYLAHHGSDSSQPYGPEQMAHARDWLDSEGWIPWDQVRSVLCLAAAGGQQALLFASLNCQVTSVDLSSAQLQLDRDVAERYNLDIECIEADMLDLSSLHGRRFDLVYQAVSACYVPAVLPLYREVFRVLKPGGYYRVEHWNPVHVQLSEMQAWDGEAYRVARPQRAGEPMPWIPAKDEDLDDPAACWHYIHPLDHLIGGLCDAGFVILRFAETRQGDVSAEPGSHAHLAAYLPPFFALLAQRNFVPDEAKLIT